MDGLDTSILKMLQADGRAPIARIAREVGVSEGTVRRRLSRFLDEEFVRIVALVDPEKSGIGPEALIGLEVDPDKIDEVANNLTSFKEIGWLSITTGAYDVFAWATLESHEALSTFLRVQIGSISGVRRTETFVNLAVLKRGPAGV